MNIKIDLLIGFSPFFGQIRNNEKIQLPIVKNFDQWADTMQPALDKALREVNYPEIDYFG